MKKEEDDKFMKRCLELASGAEGMTYPNPLVGSVIVHNGIIAGEGYHIRAGEPHAEVHAINSVSDKSILSESTLYVNLEPCSHFGKTPPCSDLIISSGIRRVVIGAIDTSEKVSGRGVEKLKSAGCEVITGVLEDESREINKRFFTFNEKHRPYIILKWAKSADCYIDHIRSEGPKATHAWISGKAERVLVHKWRASEQAILVGAGTVRADNPKLNVREWKGNDPIKIILSSSGKIKKDSLVYETNGTLIMFTHNSRSLNHKGEKVLLNNDITVSKQIVDYLYSKGIQSLFIEGGAKVLTHFISSGLWDEARIFTGKDNFTEGVKSPEFSGKLISSETFSGSTLRTYKPGN